MASGRRATPPRSALDPAPPGAGRAPASTPAAVFDEAALADAVRAAVARRSGARRSTRRSRWAPTGRSTTPARAGVAVDPAPVVGAAVRRPSRAGAAAEVVVPVAVEAVAPAPRRTPPSNAPGSGPGGSSAPSRSRAPEAAWTIPADKVRGWVSFEWQPDGTRGPGHRHGPTPRRAGEAHEGGPQAGGRRRRTCGAEAGASSAWSRAKNGRELDRGRHRRADRRRARAPQRAAARRAGSGSPVAKVAARR